MPLSVFQGPVGFPGDPGPPGEPGPAVGAQGCRIPWCPTALTWLCQPHFLFLIFLVYFLWDTALSQRTPCPGGEMGAFPTFEHTMSRPQDKVRFLGRDWGYTGRWFVNSGCRPSKGQNALAFCPHRVRMVPLVTKVMTARPDKR